MYINFCREIAKLFAVSEVRQNPRESFDEFTFPGQDVGLGKGEFVIVTYKRRKIEGGETLSAASMNPAAGQRFEYELRGMLLTLCALFLSVAYALPYYLNRTGGDFEMHMKPFVYRQLSIKPVEWMQSSGLSYETAALLFVGISGITFLFALMCLMDTGEKEVIAFILLALFTMLFQYETKPYDLMTASLFTIALTLMARWRLNAYLFIFALSCMNRETTILLLPVFMLHFRKQITARRYWGYVAAQVLIFASAQAVIRYAFRGAPGVGAWISPMQNIGTHLNHPLGTLISMAAVGLILWLVFRGWASKPLLLRTAFVVLAPAFVFLYFVFGQAFEYRVFAEVYPVTALLAVKGLTNG